MSRVVDLVKDPVITHAYPKKPFMAGHRLHAVRTGGLFKTIQMRLEPPSDRKRKPQELALS